jgi:hypothetical protein
MRQPAQQNFGPHMCESGRACPGHLIPSQAEAAAPTPKRHQTDPIAAPRYPGCAPSYPSMITTSASARPTRNALAAAYSAER